MGLFSIFETKNNNGRIAELIEENALIIDVRTPDEYRSGHITQSVNIPLDTIPMKINELKRKNKAIITCCRSGARSGMAADQLRNAGIDVENGGSWNSLEGFM
ncbi:MAG: rhodanese-like domain-containing protein [Flavobacteriales bacterium]|nr:rhodanese-like domain-containing protein [Flavobacteriales bacterium]